MTTGSHPGVNQLKASLPEAAYSRSTAKGIAIFLISATGYGLSFWMAVGDGSWVLRVLGAALSGIFTALLFVIGHDACHGSLTPSNRWNQFLGRVAFLPSWHPFSCWDLGHNKLHHCFTNLRTRDYVWAPLSKEEYDRLSPVRRWVVRFYRSIPGVGAYYFFEIWLRHMIFPTADDRQRLPVGLAFGDRALVAAFIGLQCALSVMIGGPSPAGVIASLFFAVLLPQLIWNAAMGLVILLHHTHPRVRWYDDPADWSFFAGQVQGTVHVLFPRPIGFILHHIMEHTAHHIEPKIPLYHLPEAQVAVEADFPADVIVSRFTLANLRQILATCQLYDYETHRWLSFDGSPSQINA